MSRTIKLELDPKDLESVINEAVQRAVDATVAKLSEQLKSQVAPSKMLLTQDEAAEALCLSKRKVSSLTSEGELRAVRVGTRTLYDPLDLRAWIEKQKTNT